LGQSELRAAELVHSSPFSLLSQQVEETPPGAHGLIFLPYMAGERSPLWNSDARGVFFGLSYKTTRGDVVRSIMEGCALAVQHNVRVAAEHNVFVREWIGVGGATRSNVWCQIKADVTNRPFVVARRADGGEGGHTLGLTAMIRKALGLCDDLAEQMDAYLPHRRVCEPSAERHAMYQDLLEIYMKLSTKLQPDFADLAAAVAAYPEFLADS
jgi:xylulokinase